jgi:hypothetical protein
MLIKVRKFRAASNTDKNIINFYSAASRSEPRAEHRNLHPATLIACLLARVSHRMTLFPLTETLGNRPNLGLHTELFSFEDFMWRSNGWITSVVMLINVRKEILTNETYVFRRVRKIAGKRFLASSCLSVPFGRNNWTPTGRILMKFDIWAFFKSKICWET